MGCLAANAPLLSKQEKHSHPKGKRSSETFFRRPFTCLHTDQSPYLRPVKQTGDGADGDADACGVDAADFFFKRHRADQRSQDDDADVHACEDQRRVVFHHLVGGDVGNDVGEIQTAQDDAADNAFFRPFGRLGEKVAEHQNTGEAEGDQKVAGKRRTTFGKLFEEDVDDAVARPNARKQRDLRTQSA